MDDPPPWPMVGIPGSQSPRDFDQEMVVVPVPAILGHTLFKERNQRNLLAEP